MNEISNGFALSYEQKSIHCIIQFNPPVAKESWERKKRRARPEQERKKCKNRGGGLMASDALYKWPLFPFSLLLGGGELSFESHSLLPSFLSLPPPFLPCMLECT